MSTNCGSCSAKLPANARFCPQCGQPFGASPPSGERFTMDDFKEIEKTDERPSDLLCPRCEINLTESVYGDLAIDECFACGGTWFDDKELQAFAARFRKRKEEAEGPPLGEHVERFTLDAKVQYLKCPRCQQMMGRKNFGRISGVIIDRCGDHGYWLDGSEVEKIVAFIQTGGLVEEQKRRVADLKREAASAESSAEISRRTYRRYGPGTYWGPMVFWNVW
jgi:Zn-finger nucleic acid-binding protein